MDRDRQEIARKLKILRHADATGEVARTYRYFGIGRASFYRWLTAYRAGGEATLVNGRPIPKNPPNQTPPGIVEKVLHLRQAYHLGPVRIVWYPARYYGIKISDASVYRVLRRHNLNRLPRGTRARKIHTKRYNKQVPGHHIQMDVKFLAFEGKAGPIVRRFQYTAIDEAIRIRALKICSRHTRRDGKGHSGDRRTSPTLGSAGAGSIAGTRDTRPGGNQGAPPPSHVGRIRTRSFSGKIPCDR